MKLPSFSSRHHMLWRGKTWKTTIPHLPFLFSREEIISKWQTWEPSPPILRAFKQDWSFISYRCWMLLWLHLTAGCFSIPPPGMFFFFCRCCFCNNCRPVISIDRSLAAPCALLPSVHMCLHSSDREVLWLTAATNGNVAAAQTASRLHARLSQLYHYIGGSAHKGKMRSMPHG